MHKAFEYFEDFLKVAARLIILQIKKDYLGKDEIFDSQIFN